VGNGTSPAHREAEGAPGTTSSMAVRLTVPHKGRARILDRERPAQWSAQARQSLGTCLNSSQARAGPLYNTLKWMCSHVRINTALRSDLMWWAT
jgi:hypothetical protein